MPDDLDEVGKQEWRRIIAEGLKLEVLTKADRAIVESAVRAYSTWRRNERVCDKDGYTYETEGTDGQRMIKQNPAASIAAEAARRYLSAIGQIGLSPAARPKVNTVDPDEIEEPTAKYFH